jgi:sugar lactone lactonase YvrE
LLALVSVGLVACGIPLVDADSACAGPNSGQVEVFASSFDEGIRGIAFSPDGRLFVAAGDAVVEVYSDGSSVEVAAVERVLGLAWWGTELAVSSWDSGLGDGRAGLYRVAVDSGAVVPLVNGIEGAEVLAVSPWGSLLAADRIGGRVFEVTGAGTVSVWLEGLDSPSGLAFDANWDALWVATAGGFEASLWRVPLAGRVAGAPQLFAVDALLHPPDGLAVDAIGNLYIAQSIGGRVDRVGPDGFGSVLAMGVDGAASLAFGEADPWGLCSLYVASLPGPALFRVAAGQIGSAPPR